MLKRSLALGALMAFVITGQAWAENAPINSSLENGTGTLTITGATGITNAIYAEENNDVKILGYNNIELDGKWDSGTTDRNIFYTNKGNLTIGSEKTPINFKDTTNFNNYSIVFHAMDGNINVDAKSLHIENFGNAFVVQGNAEMTINADSIYLESNTTSSAISAMTFKEDTTVKNPLLKINTNNLTIKTDNGYGIYVSKGYYNGNQIVGYPTSGRVEIDATGGIVDITSKKGITLLEGQDENKASVKIEANNLKVNTTEYAISSDKNGSTYLEAPTIELNAVGASVTEIKTVSMANNSDITIVGNAEITAINNGTGRAYGVYGASGAEIDLADTTITATSAENNAYAVYATGSEVNITGDANIKANGKSSASSLYISSGSTLNMSGNNIDITAESGDAANGIVVYNSNVVLGSKTTENINITLNVGEASKPDNLSKGIWVYDSIEKDSDSNLTINGSTLCIDITTEAGPAFGINSQNISGSTDANLPKIQIGEDTKTVITIVDKNDDAVGHGVSAMGGSIIDIKGDTYITAENVIVARGNSTVNIGQEDKIVQLNGNILFDYATNSGTTIDAGVNIVLDGEKSYLDGNIIADEGAPEGKDVVNGMILAVTDGANWTTDSNSFVNKLTVGGSDASLNLVGDSAHTVLIGDATFKDGSKLYIKNGENYLKDTDNYALEVGKLTVENGAKIEIGGIAEGKTYNVAKGENATKEVGEKWTIDNNLLTGTWNVDTEVYGLQVTTKAKKADEIASDMGVDSGTASALGSIIEAANNSNVSKESEAAQNVVKFAQEIASASPEVAAAAAEAVIKMAEAGGNSATAANIVKNVTGVTNDRLSFNCGHSAPHKGGHGVGLFEEGSGADIWVEYVHGKDKVEDMPSSAGATSYEGQYNGFVMGVDFKKVNKFQSGIAFNYGEGDTNTVGSAVRTHSDYDFWGIGYYGNIHNDDSNVIFDINYAQTDSDVTQKNITDDLEASPETTTWTAGVKVEKLYQNENVQIVPYTGLRYMSIDADDYSTKGGSYHYKMERQDIWLLPVGVSIRQEVANDNGWTVSPRVDLSYIWAFGDTDSNMGFGHALDNKITNIGYDVMDDGSFLGLVGIEAHKGQWGYGVAYSYQKGDHSESKKWYVDVNYSF